jgi:hypothetical protein
MGNVRRELTKEKFLYEIARCAKTGSDGRVLEG